jgi:hypothetical protein
MMQALMYTEPICLGLGQFWTPMVDQFSMPMAACIEGRQKKNPLRETRKGFRK